MYLSRGRETGNLFEVAIVELTIDRCITFAIIISSSYTLHVHHTLFACDLKGLPLAIFVDMIRNPVEYWLDS